MKFNIDYTNDYGMNGFLMACAKNNVKVIKYLVNVLKMNIDQTNWYDDNGFMVACQYNNDVNALSPHNIPEY